MSIRLSSSRSECMLLSTEIGALSRTLGEVPAVELLAQAGFDAYDLSLFSMGYDPESPFCKEGYREYAQALRRAADQAGVVCNQAHAPYPSSVGDPVQDEAIYKRIIRAMEIASIAGAKIIVVHPKQHLTYRDPGNPEKLEEMNIAFYQSLIPYCEQFGIRVAVENMWQYDLERSCIVDSTCSRAEEFCRYIDRIGSPWIVGCLDIGHVPLVGEDLPRMIQMLGSARLQALHVHDNDLHHDNHALPYTMQIDFSSVTQALREIGYQGDMTFEAHDLCAHLPPAAQLSGARLLHDVGRSLIQAVQG